LFRPVFEPASLDLRLPRFMDLSGTPCQPSSYGSTGQHM
jgi:hypothetical protein